MVLELRRSHPCRFSVFLYAVNLSELIFNTCTNRAVQSMIVDFQMKFIFVACLCIMASQLWFVNLPSADHRADRLCICCSWCLVCKVCQRFIDRCRPAWPTSCQQSKMKNVSYLQKDQVSHAISYGMIPKLFIF